MFTNYANAIFDGLDYETDGVEYPPYVPPVLSRRRGTPINQYKRFKTVANFRER